MKYLKIEVEDFQGVARRSVDLTDVRYATVVGANGAGKSTLFIDAPMFALFGRASVRESLADVVRRGADTALVDFTFELDGHVCRVRRTYSTRTKAGAQSLEVWKDGEPLTGATVTETQRTLDLAIGVTFETMVMGAIMRQGESDRFARCTPSERLRLLGALLGADRYREARTEASQRARGLEGELRSDVVRVGQLDALKTKLAEILESAKATADEWVPTGAKIAKLTHDLRELPHDASFSKEFPDRQKIIEAKAGLEELVKKHRAQYAKAVEGNQEIDRLFAQRDTLIKLAEAEEAKLEKLKASPPDRAVLAEVAKKGGELKALAEKALEAAQLVEKIDRERAELERQIASLEKQTGALKLRPNECQMNHCGLIRAAVTADHEANQLIAALAVLPVVTDEQRALAGKSKQLEAELIATREKYSSLAQEIKGYGARVEEQELAVKKARNAVAESPVVRSAKADLAELATKHEVTEQVLKAELAELEKAEVAFRSEWEKARSDNAAKRQELQAELAGREAESKKVELALVRLQTQAEELEKQVAEIEAVREKIAEGQKKINVLNYAIGFLTVAPQLVVERALPVIEQVANEVLESIQPGAQIEVRQSRETKAGTVKDEVGVIVIADGYEAPLATFSGGERFRLDLALRLGIAAASGATLETLVIDEGWGSQDAEKLEQVKEAIGAMTDRFPRIYTISHVTAVEDMFGAIVKV